MTKHEIVQPSAAWPPRVEELYAKADALDAVGFANGFAPEGSFTFGNAPAVVGREAIEEALRGFFGTVSSMSHRPVKVWAAADEVIFEAVVTYGRLDGTQVDVPAVTALSLTGHQVYSCRIYCDMAPLATA